MPFIPLETTGKANDSRFPRVSSAEQSARDADAEAIINQEFDQPMPAASRAALETDYRQRFGKGTPEPETGILSARSI